MTKLVYTPNIPFDMHDWRNLQSIREVAAGCNSLLAVLNDGSVLYKSANAEQLKGNLPYQRLFANCFSPDPVNGGPMPLLCWKNIVKADCSKYMDDTFIGLRKDGTCLAYTARPSGRRIVEDWTDIVEVAASDAFFGLDRNGEVHHIHLTTDRYNHDDYFETEFWHDIEHIRGGVCNSVFGITSEGKVVCEGGNCSQRIKDACAEKEDVVDIYVTGSEAQDVFFLHKDGSFSCLDKWFIFPYESDLFVQFAGHWSKTVFAIQKDRTLVPLSKGMPDKITDTVLEWSPVMSIAFGQKNYDPPFAVAVLE